jgi:short-subunit dehydrogenase
VIDKRRIYNVLKFVCVGHLGRFLSVPTSEFRRCMEVNYFGLLNTARVCAEKMVERRRGDIMIVSSGLSLTAYMVE